MHALSPCEVLLKALLILFRFLWAYCVRVSMGHSLKLVLVLFFNPSSTYKGKGRMQVQDLIDMGSSCHKELFINLM